QLLAQSAESRELGQLQRAVRAAGWKEQSEDRSMVMLEPRRIDGSIPGVSSSMEDILQFALKPKPLRPVPEVVQVELGMRIFHDTQCIFKIMRATGLELKQDQVLRTTDIQRDAEKLKGASASKR